MARPVEFGFFLVPTADDPLRLVGQARLAEELGLDLIGIQDHPYQRRYLDTWALLAYLAAATSRIRLFADVANLPLRPPAVMAKAAASLDLLSGGRFELGLGAGGFREAVAAMGGPALSAKQSVDALEEAMTVIRLMWSQERSVSFQGEHYQLKGVHPGPPPAHDMGIWIGAYGPRMMRVIGRFADGWVPSLRPDSGRELLSERQGMIDEAALAAGRRPEQIRRILNVSGRIAEGPLNGYLDGPAAHWREELARLHSKDGFDAFIFWPTGDVEEQLKTFAEDVAARV